jgi:hypothetical protein
MSLRLGDDSIRDTNLHANRVAAAMDLKDRERSSAQRRNSGHILEASGNRKPNRKASAMKWIGV